MGSLVIEGSGQKSVGGWVGATDNWTVMVNKVTRKGKWLFFTFKN